MFKRRIIPLCLCILLLTGCNNAVASTSNTALAADVPAAVTVQNSAVKSAPAVSLEPHDYKVPDYQGKAEVAINNDVPFFSESDLTSAPFERYSELDSLGRCGVAYANVCKELMPTEPRGDIGMIKPSGWVQNKYPELIADNYLYNRCHLIGFQLAGENANPKNLITGTRYLNIEGMLGLENSVADYIAMYPDNHVLYRVTPVFEGDNLLCNGVLMEALSVEDHGAGLKFCRFAYNVQPGIEIDYATGANHKQEGSISAEKPGSTNSYVINTRSMKFHEPDCEKLPSDKNRQDVTTTRDELISQGYSPCGICNP